MISMHDICVRYLSAALIATCLCIGPYSYSIAQSVTPFPVSEIRFDNDGGVIALPVTVGNISRRFVLDSGSSRHLFDVSFRESLGEPLGKFAANRGAREVEVELFSPPAKTQLGDLDVSGNKAVVCFDLTGVREASGQEVFGILGLPFLSRWIVQFDFDNGLVRFYPPGSYSDSWGSPLPLKREGPMVAVDLAIGEMAEVFVLDTGSTSEIVLNEKSYEQLENRRHLRSLGQGISTMLGGDQLVRNGRLNVDVLCDDFSLKNILISTGRNRVGLHFLSRFVATVDIPGGRMYLRKSKQYSATRFPNMSGIHLLRRREAVLADKIDKNSQAEKAGLKNWDHLVEINGNDASKLSLAALRQIFSGKPGRTHPTFRHA